MWWTPTFPSTLLPPCSLHPEDGDSIFLRKAGVLPHHYLVSQPRRPRLEETPRFYGIRRLITVFTKPCHWILTGASLIQSTHLHTVKIYCNVFFSFLFFQVVSSTGIYRPKYFIHFSSPPCVLCVPFILSSLI
jgi:hypothetical protein